MKMNVNNDAMGNRISKTVTNKNETNGDKFVTTYYVRNPQGIVLAVYEHKHGDSDNGIFTLAEQHLYGAGRLGMRKRDLALNATNTSESPATYYELTNHLGNVMAVISDEASATDEPTVVSLSDYYPFGMTEPGRSWNAGAEGYRYGFNTQENVTELGEGHTTALYWEYDGRLGKRWNMDPKSNPMLSSYATFGCNPILLSDVLGDSSVVDSKGYFIGDIDENDRRVFMLESEGAEPILIGEFGKTIDANPWLGNLIDDNEKYVLSIMSHIDYRRTTFYKSVSHYALFKEVVKEGARFDYKYRTSKSQHNLKYQKDIEMSFVDDRQHILGYAFYISDGSSLGIGSEEGKVGEVPTMFIFNGVDNMRAQDVNNFHYGALGVRLNLSESFLKVAPGLVEQKKQIWDYWELGDNNADHWWWIFSSSWGDHPTDAYFVQKGISYGEKK